MEDPNESVPERSESLGVRVSVGSALVVERPASDAGVEGAECPAVDGIVETVVADVSGDHRAVLAGGDRDR